MNFLKKEKSPKKLQWSLVAYTPHLPSLTCVTQHVQTRRAPHPNVLRKKTSHVEEFSRETFREKLCKKDILREGHFARDFEREESDSSISYVRTSGHWFKSPNPYIQSSCIDRFESFDLVNFLESIDSKVDSSRDTLSSKEIFFKILFSRVHAWVRAHKSLTPLDSDYVRTSDGQKKHRSVRHVL